MYKYYHQFKQYLRPAFLQKKQLQTESAFYATNKIEVLRHYRYLLKHVPKLYPRKLQQRSAYIEICHLFHESKVLSSLQQTSDRANHLQQFVGQLKKGENTVLGTMLPARAGGYLYVKGFFYDLRKYRLE